MGKCITIKRMPSPSNNRTYKYYQVFWFESEEKYEKYQNIEFTNLNVNSMFTIRRSPNGECSIYSNDCMPDSIEFLKECLKESQKFINLIETNEELKNKIMDTIDCNNFLYLFMK